MPKIDSLKITDWAPGTTLPYNPPAGAASFSNADTVDFFHASTTPIANYLVALDANALLPLVAIPSGIDHGGLAGLGDDDHTQYILKTTLSVDGDILFRSGGVVAKLAVGAAGEILAVSGALPSYQPQTYIDHGSISGLGDDDHTQYARLAGRAGGQTLIGGTGTTDDLILRATAGVGASGSDIILQVGNNGATEALRVLYDGNVGIGTASPKSLLQLSSTVPTVGFEETDATADNQRWEWRANGETFYGRILNNAYTVATLFMQVDRTGTTVDYVSFPNGNVGIGAASPSALIHGIKTTEQLRLGYDASNYASFTVGSGGNLTAAPTGDWIFDPTGNDILPNTNYDLNLGSLAKKYLTLHAAELWVETLVAQNTIATIGGRVLIGPTTVLTSDLAAGGTTIYVKHNEMASGDRVYLEANGSVEFLAITSAPGGVGPYSYTVTRDLDGSGANQWYAGDAVFNTGTTGEGFIDLYSVRGVKAGTQYGPTIVGNIRNSATYNDWTEHWAIGQLNGIYGYGASTWGVALGEYAANKAHITIDSTNGLRIFNGTATVIGQWDISGNITVGQVGASKSNIYITSGALQMRNNTTVQGQWAANGDATFGEVAASKSNIFISSGALQVRLNTTVLGQWDASGNITIGQVAASQSNVYITSGQIALRNNTTNKILLNADGTSSFEGVMNIGTSGGIFQGTGTFASPTTALKIYNSGGVGLLELWGSGAKKLASGTDGKLTVLGDSSLQFADSNGNVIGNINTLISGASHDQLYIRTNSGRATAQDFGIQIGPSPGASCSINGSGVVTGDANTSMIVANSAGTIAYELNLSSNNGLVLTNNITAATLFTINPSGVGIGTATIYGALQIVTAGDIVFGTTALVRSHRITSDENDKLKIQQRNGADNAWIDILASDRGTGVLVPGNSYNDAVLNFTYVTNTQSTFGTAWAGPVMRDNQTDGCRVTWHVPTDFGSLTLVEIIGLPDGTGNMIWDVYTNAGADGEAWNNQAANMNTQTKAVTTNNQFRINCTSAFPGTIAVGDAVGILFQRQGGHASDTVSNIVTVLGIRIKYKRAIL